MSPSVTSDEFSEFAACELSAVIGYITRPSVRIFLRFGLLNNTYISIGHAGPQVPVNDIAIVAVEDTARVT